MAVRRSMDTETLLQPTSETGGGHFGRPAPELPQAVGHNADTRKTKESSSRTLQPEAESSFFYSVAKADRNSKDPFYNIGVYDADSKRDEGK